MNQTYKHSTAVIRTACAIVFILFTFLYLYYYQADLLAYSQHVFSSGRTHYNHVVGATLITLVLSLLSFGVWSVTKLDGACHALVYFPSLLALTVLTSAVPVSQQALRFPSWLWVTPVLLALFIGFILFRRQSPLADHASYFNLMRVGWINFMSLALMLLGVGLLSNHDNVVHFRLQAENNMKSQQFAKALLAGKKSPDTDESLTMLRVYALSATHQLPEKLFTYPLKGGSKSMLPQPSGAHTLLLPAKDIVQQSRRDALNYQLCGALLDKNIDRFAQLVKAHELVNDSVKLPRHYAEALTLYTHLRSTPVVIYKHNVLETDYKDYQKVDREATNERERKNRLRDTFGNTYWYYYQYGQ